MNDPLRIDGSKLEFHPARVAAWHASGDDWERAKAVYPIYAEITTCGACNHRCTFCSVDAIGYKPILADKGMLWTRLEEMAALGVKSVMFAGEGEPLLHNEISKIVAHAAIHMDVAITTNGVLLHKLDCVEACQWIKVSMNAGTAKTYAAVHRTKERDFGEVWDNIAAAAARKGSCMLGVQSVLLPENRAEMFLLAHRARDAGADYLVIKPYSQGTFSLTHQYEGVDYSRDQGLAEALQTLNSDTFRVIFRAESMKQERESHHYEKCNATPFFWVYMMANGDVFTCSAHLMDQRFNIGNLNRQTFKEIWEGEKRRENWKMMRETFSIKQCRKNCRMDKSNIYLDGFKTQQHVNFI